IPDPAHQLLTDVWPAPAVATWKAVAEVFLHGVHSMPSGSIGAIALGGGAGLVLTVLEKKLAPRYARFVPSAASIGLAFVMPANDSLLLFLGAFLAYGLSRLFPAWSSRFVIVIAAGLIAGESLTGVGIAVHGLVGR